MVRVLIPSGALGLGWDEAALARGIAAGPDLIAIDGGSTDSGPSYLGRGVSKYSRAATLAEWQALLAARAEAGVPLVLGTAGTCGADAAVDWMVDITREALGTLGLSARVAVLRSGQPAERVAEALAAGRITPLDGAPGIDAATLHECTNIVALAGAEQVAAALEMGPDIVIAGRTTDTAIIAAPALMRGIDPGLAWHGAKIGECGALCASRPQSGVLMVEYGADAFTVTPLAEGSRATAHTVSAHMLYENSDPERLIEPGGVLDVSAARYEGAEPRSVRVSGGRWHPDPVYKVKLEGARRAGFQTILLTLVRDARYVANIRGWCADIEAKAAAKIARRLGPDPADRVELRRIGVDAAMGDLEMRAGDPAEAGVLAIVTAASQARASEIARLLNPYLLHHPLTEAEEQPTFAFPFSPPEIERGALHEFCLNHVMALDDPMAAFSLEVLELAHAPA